MCEIDDSLFVKVKHHKGKDLIRHQQWVFGIYERNTKKYIFIPVPKRCAFTSLNILLNKSIIYQNVQPGTIIYSNCWRAYCRIRDLDKSF